MRSFATRIFVASACFQNNIFEMTWNACTCQNIYYIELDDM